ncbi:hypothetical protein CYLTODRAFT_398392 [Cylindrobasidium torrendii FP15055 ss-10]|uniref:NAD(P)-binding domain-containing protein n=1 Tax=Cylindrobasidium torrendii FP15055 ss-10 TaxID=1314674 RepID=A0A0D7B8U7_9AGAR|nr:hypothetical protein CYLTODRAFT_398392 [Cylindrobasidium torrendii FP15055 ss-10]
MASTVNNVLVFGGSRNIGYYSALRFLRQGASVNFMLRSTSVFDDSASHAELQTYIKSGKAKLLKGDALVNTDVKSAYEAASACSPVDLVLFTVGGIPEFSLTKGFVLNPPDLVSKCFLNVICSIPTDSPNLKCIFISSSGLTKKSHRAAVPGLFKPLYSHFLAGPHRDKIGMERVLAYCTGWSWEAEDGEATDVLGTDWRERTGLPAPGSLENVLVIRPALLTDGECVAETDTKGKAPYRIALDADLKGYTISRKDVSHLVAVAATEKWNEYKNKIVGIVY